MKKLFVTMFALLAVGFASAQSEVIAKFNEGVTAMKAKNYAGAISLFETAIDKGLDSEDSKVVESVAGAKKNLVQCYRIVGTQFASKGDFSKAIEYLKKAADTAELYDNNPEKFKANNVLSKIYQVLGGKAYQAKDYASAVAEFEKGYAVNPRNTEMALYLAASYCELGKYDEGMAIYEKICKMPAEKYADAIAKATEKKTLYTNNKVASLQQAGDFDGVIAMAEKLQATTPALAEKIRIEAYNGKKDYAKVIALGETAVAAQTDEEGKSAIHLLVAAAYNALYNAGGNKDASLRDKAIETFKKVTSGSGLEAAKAALADLTK